MKILLSYGYEEREKWGMACIESAIHNLSPNTKVCVLQRGSKGFLTDALRFNPDVVAGPPPTAYTVSHPYYHLKATCGARIFSLPSEGVGTYVNNIYWYFPRIDMYGPKLIDAELFWGVDALQHTIPLLLKAHKISSADRGLVVGSPLFEVLSKNQFDLPKKLKEIFATHKKEKIVLLMTGYPQCEYDMEKIIRSQDYFDPDPQKNQERIEITSKVYQRYCTLRQLFLESLRECASENEDMLFIVNPHPVERCHFLEDYGYDPVEKICSQYSNVYYNTDIIDACFLIDYCGAVVHSGSSGVLAAYFTNTFSIDINPRNYFEDLENIDFLVFESGMPSSLKADVADFASAIKENKNKFGAHVEVEGQWKFLSGAINFKPYEPYAPSEKIAKALLDTTLFSFQDITSSPEDMFFLERNSIVSGLSRKKSILGRVKQKTKDVIIGTPFEPWSRSIYSFTKQYINKQKKTVAQSAPSVFSVETVLGCNLQCVECAIGSGHIKRAYGCLKLENFEAIATKIKPYCNYLYLHLWGEPMLNPDIIPMIQVASKFTKVNISTNANTLTKKTAMLLATSGVSDIIVSIDGVSQEVYETYRKNGSVEKAISGLKLLSKFVPDNVSVIPQFIVFDHNEHEMGAFVNLCNSLGLQATFKAPYLLSDTKLKASTHLPQYVRKKQASPQKRFLAMQSCTAKDTDFIIHLNGDVVSCCYDTNAQIVFGNIFEESVENIWNSEGFSCFRKQLAEGKPPSFCIKNCLLY